MFKKIYIVLLILVIAVGLYADVPRLISYQGRLFDDLGNPITGSHDLIFRLYDDEGDPEGACIWNELHSVIITDEGLYHVMLGAITPFPGALDFSEQYWLGITLDSEAEMTRYELSSVPYALRADVADSVLAGCADTFIAHWSSVRGIPSDVSDGVSGTGTVNYFPLWTSDSTLTSAAMYSTPSHINTSRDFYIGGRLNIDEIQAYWRILFLSMTRYGWMS